MQTVSELNEQYTIADNLQFQEISSGFIVADLSTEAATARIAVQGAQVLEWQPSNAKPVIWLSDHVKFIVGKSPRGGVPVCWPWFGPHATQSSFPSHGVVRNAMWRVSQATMLPSGTLQLEFKFDPIDSASQPYWSPNTPVTLRVTVGSELELELVTQNKSDQPVTFSEALHTYFAVSHIEKVTVTGLEEQHYIDKVDVGKRKLQIGPVFIKSEVDRVYLNSASECVINDAGWGRSIKITKQGSQSTIVWNPWIEKSKSMGDMGASGFQNMVCVESGNALENEVSVAPQDQHRLYVQYRLEQYS